MRTRLEDAVDETIDDLDNAISPKHYKLTLPTGERIEAIDYIHAVLGDKGMADYCRGSALKYLSRAGRKDSCSQDLRKAAWFCITAAQVLEDIES